MVVPPLSPYGTLTGQLFLYAGGRAAFESPMSTLVLGPSKKCILLGGLSDGLLPVPYTALLEQACHDANEEWSLVQPILSSSYTGFGHGTLDRDVQELQELLVYLKEHRQATEYVLVGHSTGCQVLMHYLAVFAAKQQQQQQQMDDNNDNNDIVSMITGLALQAPVSDREGAETNPSTRLHLEWALKQKELGLSQEMMPRQAFWAPMTVERYLDLHQRGGRDDYFSSDYTDDELRARLQHVGNHPPPHGPSRRRRRCLVAFSGLDEYVPAHVDRPTLLNRLVHAMNHHHHYPINHIGKPLGKALGVMVWKVPGQAQVNNTLGVAVIGADEMREVR